MAPWQIHYVDTDSIIYSSDKNSSKLKTGSGLGDLTNEIESLFGLEDTIDEWCATGNKSYSFKLRNHPDKSIVKVKGFTLDLTANAGKDVGFQ